MPDAAEYVQLTASYFEFTITDAMLAELKSGGCIVTGIGFSLTGVDLIDPTQIPSMTCTVNNADIKCWEAGEQPQVTVTLQSLEGNDMNTTVTLKLRTDAYEDYFTKTENVTVQAGGTATVTIPLTLEPGFYHAVVEANYGLLRDFNIGFNPTAITAQPDMQPDFNEFWPPFPSTRKSPWTKKSLQARATCTLSRCSRLTTATANPSQYAATTPFRRPKEHIPW